MNITEFHESISSEDFSCHAESFSAFLIRGHIDNLDHKLRGVLQAIMSHADIVDISYLELDATEYIGELSQRKVINMPLSLFISMYVAEVGSGDKFSLDSWRIERPPPTYSKDMLDHYTELIDKKKLYLSQLPLLGVDVPELPNCLKCPKEKANASSIFQSNLWINLQGKVSSSLHYDGYHNILSVLAGVKEVVLISPEYTEFLRPYPAHSSSANHSFLTAAEIKGFGHSDPGVLPAAFLHQVTTTITVSAGDVLFIPEGWWHHVTSSKCTVAVNYWFHSPLHKLLDGGRRINPSSSSSSSSTASTSTSARNPTPSYLLRASLLAAIDAKSDANTLSLAFLPNQPPASKWSGYQGVPPGRGYGDTGWADRPLPVEFATDLHALHELLLVHNSNRSSVALPSADGGPVSVQSDIEALQWLAFCSPRYAAQDRMTHLWPLYAQQHPAKWTTILLSLSPATVQSLIGRWEAMEEANSSLGEEFFRGIYSPCGSLATRVQSEFDTKLNIARRETAEGILNDILGIAVSAPSSSAQSTQPYVDFRIISDNDLLDVSTGGGAVSQHDCGGQSSAKRQRL